MSANQFMKRIFEITFVLATAVVTVPVTFCLSFIVWRKMGRPIFFQQSRPGRYGKSFNMIKFRTMKNVVDSDGRILSDSDRLTPFGRLLRSTSFDELPELWNVLKGEMSLVGPRPLLIEYLPFYSKEQYRRHEVKPGITGWAQVNGRNAISWEEKFKFDVWYVDNHSFFLDIKIISLTIKKVFLRDGISPIQQEIMPRFDRR